MLLGLFRGVLRRRLHRDTLGAWRIMSDQGHQSSKVVTWLRLNLALTMALVSLISVSLGFLIATTVRVTKVQLTIEDSALKVVILQGNIVDVDHRLNAITAEIADLNTRAEVLKATLAFMYDRMARDPMPQLPAAAPGGRDK